MLTSALGNKAHWRPTGYRQSTQRGFTLIELMVVVTIMAIAAAAVTLSLRDGTQTTLEREGERLAALLESGRAQARATGQAWVWRPASDGFSISQGTGVAMTANTAGSPGTGVTAGTTNLPKQNWPWLQPGMAVVWPAGSLGQQLVLGPEPIIPAQAVTLQWNKRTVQISTDGLRPFAVELPR